MVIQSTKGITVDEILEKADLEVALKGLKDRLITKNVDEEIAEKICKSLVVSLVYKKLPSFTRESSTVQASQLCPLLSFYDYLISAIPPDKNVAKSKSAPIANKPEKVQLINHRRAYNCEIMLSKVNIPLHELMEEAVVDKAPQSERGIKSRAILGRQVKGIVTEQIIEVESGLGPYKIEYDEEWLAITRRKVHGGQQSM
ncbi:unnamed protein product [Lactuca saligna]|uniref:Uncharacterized protein n=1 Tax=Lactuca saligna TaxID=75948 RepID=A0AA35ZVJ4_LACSI|nr:unnamed protein product [Lactuca saligna]